MLKFQSEKQNKTKAGAKMELKGKKIVFLGDSITEGCGTSGVEHHFVTLVGKAADSENRKTTASAAQE